MNFAFIQGIGPTELIIVQVIVLVIFGPKRLPALARSLGGGIREFKDSIGGRGDDHDDDDADHRVHSATASDSSKASAQAALGRPGEPAGNATPSLEGDAVSEPR